MSCSFLSLGLYPWEPHQLSWRKMIYVSEVKQVSAGLEINSYPDCLDHWTGSRGILYGNGWLLFNLHPSSGLTESKVMPCTYSEKTERQLHILFNVIGPTDSTVPRQGTKSVMIKAWSQPVAMMCWVHWFHCSSVCGRNWKASKQQEKPLRVWNLKGLEKLVASWKESFIYTELCLKRLYFSIFIYEQDCCIKSSSSFCSLTWPTCLVVPTCLRISTYKSGVWNRGPVPQSSKSIHSQCSLWNSGICTSLYQQTQPFNSYHRRPAIH